MSERENQEKAYWLENKSLMFRLLLIWALVSFGFGMILRPLLDTIPIGGVGLGFWFAQQGSIFCFLAIIIYYAIKMKAIDKKYDMEEK